MAKTKKTSTGRRKATAGRGKKRAGTGKSAAKATKKTTRKTTTKAAKKTTRKSVTKVKVAKPKKTTKPPVKKSHLTRKQIGEFREILLQKRRTLVGDMNGMEETTINQQNGGNLSSMPTHMADVGTDNFEHEFTLGLIESEQSLLQEINHALGRIEAGTYGICLGTGHRIPLARLRAKPWAKYTVKFARMIEEGKVKAPDESAPENK